MQMALEKKRLCKSARTVLDKLGVTGSSQVPPIKDLEVVAPRGGAAVDCDRRLWLAVRGDTERRGGEDAVQRGWYHAKVLPR